MIQQTHYKQRYSCGVHVSGRGRQVSTNRGKAIKSETDYEIAKGIIVMMPGKEGDPYTVLDEQSFMVLEANEDEITAIV